MGPRRVRFEVTMAGEPGRSPAPLNPYSPPAAASFTTLEPYATGEGLVYVGFALRAGGRLLDWLVTLVLGLVGGVIAGFAVGALAAIGLVRTGWASRIDEMTGLSLLLGLAASTAYHTLSEGLGGATVGKLILGLRVVSEDASPAKVGRALLRSLAFFLDGFFFGAVAYGSMSRSPRQQRLGDKWGHTVVVRASSLSASDRRPSVAGGTVLGCLAYVLVGALGATLRAL